ncbi:MAG: hypothetical protein ABIJ21_06735 [Nanoarchaeota archaeon]
MKQLILGIILLSLTLSLVQAIPSNARVRYLTCDDTDGGLNYPVFGSVYGNLSNNSNYQYFDYCQNTATLTEWYCQGRNPKSVNYNCQNMGNYVCNMGACVLNQTPDSCSDTDGGQYPYTFGQVTGYAGGNPYTNPDTCNSPIQVKEWYCSGTQAQYNNMNCNAGDNCVAGRCVVNETNQTNHAPVVYDITWTEPRGIITFTAWAYDPDGNSTIQYVNMSYYENGIWKGTTWDYTPPYNSIVNTYDYQGPATIVAQAYDGELASELRIENLFVNNTPNSCAETDGGYDIYNFGFTYGWNYNNYYNYSDTCLTNLTLQENYCVGTSAYTANVSCLGNLTTHCQWGRCI